MGGKNTGRDAQLVDRGVPAAPIERFAPRVMVLPFIDLSLAPDPMHIADGLTIDVTTELARFPNLRVLSLNTALTYKGWPVPPQRLHDALGARYLLEGSVELSSDRLVVTVQLIRAAADEELWAERFERLGAFSLDDYDDLICQIVAGMDRHIAQVETEGALHKRPSEVNAYEAYQRAIHSFSHNTKEELQAALDLFRKVTELEPGFARAWGYLAYTTIRGVTYGWIEPAAMDQAQDWVRRALELDPTDYYNIWDLAFLHQNCGRFVQAERAYQRAWRLNPNDAELLAEMAEFSICNGTPKLAIDQMRRAIEIAQDYPRWYDWTLGHAYFASGDYGRAVARLERDPALPCHARLILAAALVHLGEPERARAIVGQVLQEEPRTSVEGLRQTDRRRRPQDRAHWLNALRAAGVPERPAGARPNVAAEEV
ncbi:MAG: tetratricopeptide repeat protein [Pseudomonadota bacterium]